MSGSGGWAEPFFGSVGAVTSDGFCGAGGTGDGESAGGAGTGMAGGETGGISGRVAGSVDAILVGGGPSPLEGAEGTQ